MEANGGVAAGEVNEFLTANPVGTGAYQLDAWNRGENFQLGVFEDYWGTPANIDVRIDIAPDTDTRILGLRAGEYDMIEIDPSLVPDLEGAEGVEIYSGGYLLEPIHIGFNTRFEEGSLPPEDTIGPEFFQDPRIRQAFNLTLRLSGIRRRRTRRPGRLPPPLLPAGDAAGTARTTRSSPRIWPRPRRCSAMPACGTRASPCRSSPKRQTCSKWHRSSFEDSMAALNPAFEIRVLAEAESEFDEAHASDPIPYALWAKNADPFADPDALMNAYIHPDGEWGAVHGMRDMYQDPDAVAGLIEEAGTELDTDARLALYSDLAPMLYDDPMWIIAGNETALKAHRDHVTGFVMNPLWPRPGAEVRLLRQVSQGWGACSDGLPTCHTEHTPSCRYATT